MAGCQPNDGTLGEQELRRAVKAGEPADLRSGSSEFDNPVDGGEWGPERTVGAHVLRDVLVMDPPPPRAVVLRGARISGGLDLEAATLVRPFMLDACFCDRPINVSEAQAPSIRFTGCKLVCVVGDQLETRGDLDLNRSTVQLLSLLGARVGGDLTLNACRLTGGRWPLDMSGVSLRPSADPSDEERSELLALVADGLRVDGDLFCMSGFSARGEVRLLGAHIGRQLVFEGAKLNNEGQAALFADRLYVGQNMFFRKSAVEGGVRLLAARIGGQLVLDGSCLSCEHGDEKALDLGEAKIPGSLWLRFAERPKGGIRLDRAEVGALHDDTTKWPDELSLRGLTYGHLEPSLAVDVKRRLDWLKRDPQGYAPQPYEQLVACYRRAGDEEAARRVAIEKQRRRRESAAPPAKAWSFFLDATVGYGYRAWLAGVWLLLLVILGWIAFGRAYPEHFRAAEEDSQVVAFQPLLYTLDLVLPVVDLEQSNAWIAEGPARWGILLTVAGWVLATVLLAVLTGLLKRD
jgi:hypothetical protein